MLEKLRIRLSNEEIGGRKEKDASISRLQHSRLVSGLAVVKDESVKGVEAEERAKNKRAKKLVKSIFKQNQNLILSLICSPSTKQVYSGDDEHCQQ